MKDPIRVNERFVIGMEQLTPQDIQSLAEDGYKSVVDLRAPGEQGQTMTPELEAQRASEAGLVYTHLPVSGDDLRPALVDRFRTEIASLPGPVFVHCSSGKRSGAFTMMHVGVQAGWSGDEVIRQAEKMGLDCNGGKLQDFIRHYVEDSRQAS